MRRAGGEDGSVFIETMIAAAIVILLLGVMYRSIADSAARHGGLEDRRTAMLIARSQMAAVGQEIPAAPGRYAGFEGNYVWQVEVSPYDAAGGALPLSRVLVTVRRRDQGAGLARLSSVKPTAAG